MPLLPANETLPSVAPAGATGVFERIDANPSSFGGLSASALAGVGRDTGRLGDVLSEHAVTMQKQYNETATDAANTAFEGRVRDTLFGEDGFYSKKGRDALDAMTPTAKALEDIRTQARESLANNEQRRMFDYTTRRSAARELYQMQNHATTEFNVWQGDEAKGAISNEVNNSATYWNDNQRFSESLAKIKTQTDKLSQLKGIDPASEAGKAAVQHSQSEAWTARIRSVMALDPNTARELFDANADYLDAPHRANLDAQITQHQYMADSREATRARTEEANAQRDQQRTQAGNLAQLTGDVLKGKPINWNSLGDMVTTQQIAPHAVDFLMSLQHKRAAGPESDKADVVIGLHRTLNDPSVSVDDKMAAISGAARGGHLTATTAGALVDKAFSLETKGDNQVARDARSSLMAGVGVPDGMVNIDHDERRRKAAALTEWTDRVDVKGEDPIQVRNDLMEKYSPPGQPPANWPRPSMGAVNSTQEVQAIAARTKAAADAGQITPEQYQVEKTNLVRFAQFYQRLDAARAAADAAMKNKPQQGGGKAKLRGVVAGEGN